MTDQDQLDRDIWDLVNACNRIAQSIRDGHAITEEQRKMLSVQGAWLEGFSKHQRAA